MNVFTVDPQPEASAEDTERSRLNSGVNPGATGA